MSDEYLFGETSGLKQSEIEIRHIFSHHVKTLNSQKWKIVDQISEWSQTLISQIQHHVSVQRQLLDQVYEKKVSYLNTICDRFLEQAVLYEQKKDIEQLNQLINQCNTLKFELAMVGCIDRPIASIQLITEEQLPQTDRDECNVNKTEEEEDKNHDNDMISNYDANSPPKLISSLLPSITKCKNDEKQFIITDHEFNTSITTHGNLLEKCPTCFMIFPQYMTAGDRNVHVNEHFKDD